MVHLRRVKKPSRQESVSPLRRQDREVWRGWRERSYAETRKTRASGQRLEGCVEGAATTNRMNCWQRGGGLPRMDAGGADGGENFGWSECEPCWGVVLNASHSHSGGGCDRRCQVLQANYLRSVSPTRATLGRPARPMAVPQFALAVFAPWWTSAPPSAEGESTSAPSSRRPHTPAAPSAATRHTRLHTSRPHAAEHRSSHFTLTHVRLYV